MKPNRFPFLVAALLLLPSLPSLAREITAEEAVRAAEAWVRRDSAPLETRLGSATAAAVRTVRDDGNAPLFHIVRMEGGGVVVTSAESGITPVIAFLDGDDVEEDARNPLWALLNRDLASRTAAVSDLRNTSNGTLRNAATTRGGTTAANALGDAESAWESLLSDNMSSRDGKQRSISSSSDIRIGPLVSTKWDQLNWNGYATFNYYTPPGTEGSTGNYYCGCVATAIAQIMKYWGYPNTNITARSYQCAIDNVSTTLSMKGGSYEWSKMPAEKAQCSTVEQRKALGKLVFDVAVASKTNFKSEGSGAYGFDATAALRRQFGYLAAKSAYMRPVTGNISESAAARNAILASLDARWPVAIGFSHISQGGGHEVVIDGYGYQSSVLYCHLNFGYSGSQDGWYNLIGENVGERAYDVLDEVDYNICPTMNQCDLVSGRVLDTSGTPISGASVTITTPSGDEATTTSRSNGIYVFVIYSASDYSLRASYGGSSSVKTVSFQSMGQTAGFDGNGAFYNGTVGNKWGVDFILDLSAPAPSAPGEVNAGDGVSTEVVGVLWNASSGASSYSVWRSTSNSSSSATCVTSGVPHCLYYDKTAVPGTLYYYWVKAVDSAGRSSGFSSSDTGYRKLAAPTISSATSSATGVALSWNAVTGATHYHVYRADSAAGLKSPLGSWQTNCTFTDTTGTANVTYYYFVQAAVNSSGTRPGDYSAAKTGVKTKDAATFTDFTPSGIDRFNFAFKVKKGFEYRIQCAQTLNGPWSTAETITPSESGTIERVITFPASWKSGFVRVITEE